MKQRTLIRNATIYDGTGGRPFFGDVLIGGGFVQKIGASSMRRTAQWSMEAGRF